MWLFKRKENAPSTAPVSTEAEDQRPVKVQNEAETTFPISDVDTWNAFFGAYQKFAGQVVNEDTAMRVSAVFACVRLISSAVSCAPVKVYRRLGDLRSRFQSHPFENMLRISPNKHITAATFWKAFMQDKLLSGNGYAIIGRGSKSDTPFALFPVRAKDVRVFYAWELGISKAVETEKNRLFYEIRFPDGNIRLYDQENVLHVPNVGWLGKGGLSTVTAMSMGVGVARSAEQSAASFFENGMQSQLAICLKRDVTDAALERFKEQLKNKYGGAGNHHLPLVVPNEGKVDTLSMSAEDAQLLESRKFSVIEICRFFGVHPVMIGENEKTSSFGGGIEQMGRWFNTLTLNEHMTAIEQELERKLFTDGCFAEFDESEITRGDSQARANYFKAALGSLQQPGWLTVNEVRAAEGYAPIAGGDELLRPAVQESAPPAEVGGGNAK